MEGVAARRAKCGEAVAKREVDERGRQRAAARANTIVTEDIDGWTRRLKVVKSEVD